MGRKIWINVVGLLKNGGEFTIWNGATEAEEVMLIVSPWVEVAKSDP